MNQQEELDLWDFGPEIPDQEVEAAIRSVPPHFSANLVVDIGNTCQLGASIFGNIQSGGAPAPTSGTVIGVGVNMNNADTMCNVVVCGMYASGILKVQVQCADSDVSGSYIDPTSGLAVLPGAFQSGGVLWLSSGSDQGLLNLTTSGQNTGSGYFAAQAFQRIGTFVRANLLSGNFATASFVGFISQLRTTGSGGGFSMLPSSGSVNV